MYNNFYIFLYNNKVVSFFGIYNITISHKVVKSVSLNEKYNFFLNIYIYYIYKLILIFYNEINIS